MKRSARRRAWLTSAVLVVAARARAQPVPSTSTPPRHAQAPALPPAAFVELAADALAQSRAEALLLYGTLSAHLATAVQNGTSPADLGAAWNEWVTNGAAVTSVPTTGPGASWVTQGATVTSVPTSGPYAQYFSGAAAASAAIVAAPDAQAPPPSIEEAGAPQAPAPSPTLELLDATIPPPTAELGGPVVAEEGGLPEEAGVVTAPVAPPTASPGVTSPPPTSEEGLSPPMAPSQPATERWSLGMRVGVIAAVLVAALLSFLAGVSLGRRRVFRS